MPYFAGCACGMAYYANVFERLACTYARVTSDICHTAVGVGVDADPGEILAVHRFK